VRCFGTAPIEEAIDRNKNLGLKCGSVMWEGQQLLQWQNSQK